jgi:F-type H+-transporting ATPase subunit alpha
VGGAAQTKAMKKAAGSVRIDLAQYREMEVFTQFASDLDDATKEQLQHGRDLMELLKQPLGRPLSMAEQVITLCVVNSHVMSGLPVNKVKDFQMKLIDYIENEHSEIIRELVTTKALSEELAAQTKAAADKFMEIYLGK